MRTMKQTFFLLTVMTLVSCVNSRVQSDNEILNRAVASNAAEESQPNHCLQNRPEPTEEMVSILDEIAHRLGISEEELKDVMARQRKFPELGGAIEEYFSPRVKRNHESLYVDCEAEKYREVLFRNGSPIQDVPLRVQTWRHSSTSVTHCIPFARDGDLPPLDPNKDHNTRRKPYVPNSDSRIWICETSSN